MSPKMLLSAIAGCALLIIGLITHSIVLYVLSVLVFAGVAFSAYLGWVNRIINEIGENS